MAEGYLRYFAPAEIVVYSAGIETHGLNPLAVKVMKNDGVDISAHTSNHIDEYSHIDFDLVLTVCDHARENCPFIHSKGLRLHQNFSDPSKIQGTIDEIWAAFEATRTEIKIFCQQLVQTYL